MSDAEQPPDPEKVAMGSAASVLLGLGVAVFITLTGYASGIPGIHHSWPLAGVEGLIIGAVVAAISRSRGLMTREGGPRRPRGPDVSP